MGGDFAVYMLLQTKNLFDADASRADISMHTWNSKTLKCSREHKRTEWGVRIQGRKELEKHQLDATPLTSCLPQLVPSISSAERVGWLTSHSAHAAAHHGVWSASLLLWGFDNGDFGGAQE